MSSAYAANIALVVTFIVIVIVLFIMIVRRGQLCRPEPPPPEDDCGCQYDDIGILCDLPGPDPPKAAVRLDDAHDPESTPSILRITRDEVTQPHFGYFKNVSINAAVTDPRGNLYVHVLNPEISGIYRLDRMLANQGDDVSAWQYMVSTGTGQSESSALYDCRDKLDVSKINTIIGLSLNGTNDDQLSLITLDGVYDIKGQKQNDDYIYRNGRYAITRMGHIHCDGVELRLPPGVSISLNDPLQVVDLSKTHSGVRYGYLCQYMGTRGLVIVRDAGPVFIPFEATAFVLIENAIFCLDYDGGLYRRLLNEDKFDKLNQLDVEINNILVGGGELGYVVSTRQ